MSRRQSGCRSPVPDQRRKLRLRRHRASDIAGMSACQPNRHLSEKRVSSSLSFAESCSGSHLPGGVLQSRLRKSWCCRQNSIAKSARMRTRQPQWSSSTSRSVTEFLEREPPHRIDTIQQIGKAGWPPDLYDQYFVAEGKLGTIDERQGSQKETKRTCRGG